MGISACGETDEADVFEPVTGEFGDAVSESLIELDGVRLQVDGRVAHEKSGVC
jgi:hypothetical protein